jgi:xylan 1,4-beta-xylosidase
LKKALIIIGMILAVSGISADLGQIDITPKSFAEIFKLTYGKKDFFRYYESNGTRLLEFSGQGVLSSARGTMPCVAGQSIVVKLNVKAENVVAASNSNALLVLLQFQNAFKRPVKEVKVFNLSHSHDWKEYERAIKIPVNAKYVSFVINNQSRKGTFLFEKLRFFCRFKDYQNIIDGAGFEHHLGRDNWFPVSGKEDNDGLPLVQGTTPQVDYENSVDGRKCLIFKNPGTVDSQMVRYNGEELIAGGWIKTDKVTTGLKSWGGASIKVIGYDGQKKYVTHKTVATVTGTKAWKFYEQKIKFTPAVKYILCRVRLFAGSRGVAWFDGVKVIGGKGKTKAFDSVKATVAVNAQISQSEDIRPIWNSVVALYPHWICNIDYPYPKYPKSLCYPGIPKIPYANESLELAKKQGFEYLRFRGIMHELDFYAKDDANGKPVYDWQKFDKFFDHVTSYGFKPLVTIDTLPKLLTKKGIPVGTYWKNYPTDFKKWQMINEAMFAHLIKRYGKKNIEKWRFHVWNEPWQVHRTEDPFFKVFDGVLAAVKKVEKEYNIDIKMGLSSGCYPPFQEDLMAHLAKNGNAKEIDAIAFHIYAGGSHSLHRFSDIFEEHKAMAKRYGFRKDVEFWCQEYNASYSSSHPKNWQGVGVNDTSFAAAVVMDANRRWLDMNLTGAAFFALRGWPNFQRKFFMLGGCGMVTKTLVPKATYHAFTFLNQLKQCRRLSLKSTNDPINGIAGISKDNKTIKIILYSVENDCTKPPYTTDVKVKMQLPQGKWKITKYWVIDKDHGDISPIWVKLKKPAYTDTDKINKIKAKAHYGVLELQKLMVNCKNNVLEVKLPMLSSSVTFLELETN